MNSAGGEALWYPTEQRVQSGELTRFRRWLVDEGRAALDGTDYRSIWEWSIRDVGAFWTAFADFSGIPLAVPISGGVAPAQIPATGWFPGTLINYAGRVFDVDRVGDAVVSVADDGTVLRTSWLGLRRQVAALAEHLRAAGVVAGERVVAVLPVGLEAVVGQLAAAAVGAVWSVVSPEFGDEAIASRLGQLDPAVLIAVDGYRYGGKYYGRANEMAQVIGKMPTLREIIWVDRHHEAPRTAARMRTWREAVAGDHDLLADQLPFEHPLWVLFSSGTTGVPKGIVHGHGGIVLEHSKVLGLHSDVTEDSVVLIVGSTSWVVWTMQVSALLRGATLVLLEGNPAAPQLDRVWRVAAEQHVTVLGVGAAYVHACVRAGLRPGADHDLSSLQMIQVTGSPLSDDGFRWVYRDVAADVWLASMSGGTDVASIFVGGVPGAAVRAGRIQGPALAVAACARTEEGIDVVGVQGELAITAAMPSMPLRFWNDPDGSRYRSAYFELWPGVWRQGDHVEFDADGSCVIHGRSDSTLNRNGIRMGPADIYRAVENLPLVCEALVVGVEEGDRYYMPLYVALVEDCDAEVACEEIRRSIRASLSPRHLPDEIIVVRAIPHTRTGKKLEVPVKRLLQGELLSQVVDLGAVDDAELLREFADLADQHRRRDVPNAHAPSQSHSQ